MGCDCMFIGIVFIVYMLYCRYQKPFLFIFFHGHVILSILKTRSIKKKIAFDGITWIM